MEETITYTGNGQVTIDLGDGRVMKVTNGGTLKRGDIPNDAFDGLAARPDFGGDFEEYRAARAAKFGALPVEDEAALAHSFREQVEPELPDEPEDQE